MSRFIGHLGIALTVIASIIFATVLPSIDITMRLTLIAIISPFLALFAIEYVGLDGTLLHSIMLVVVTLWAGYWFLSLLFYRGLAGIVATNYRLMFWIGTGLILIYTVPKTIPVVKEALGL